MTTAVSSFVSKYTRDIPANVPLAVLKSAALGFTAAVLCGYTIPVALTLAGISVSATLINALVTPLFKSYANMGVLPTLPAVCREVLTHTIVACIACSILGLGAAVMQEMALRNGAIYGGLAALNYFDRSSFTDAHAYLTIV